MTRPKKLAPEYEAEVDRAVIDLVSLSAASHLISQSTVKAAMRDVVRGAVDRSIAKLRTNVAFLDKLEAAVKERVDNSNA